MTALDGLPPLAALGLVEREIIRRRVAAVLPQLVLDVVASLPDLTGAELTAALTSLVETGRYLPALGLARLDAPDPAPPV